MIALAQLPQPTMHDEYRFIRKYWGTAWATYALLLRLATFRNPFREFPAYVSTRKVQKEQLYAQPVSHDGYEDFFSTLIDQHPLISVIIPTLNRYEYLEDVLHDLEQQTYKNFEVIIIDQSDNFDAQFYERFVLNKKVIRQKEKLLWSARNSALKNSNGSYLLFFDDDSRVQPNWITEHIKCIDYFNCDISAGVSLAAVGRKIPASYSYFRWADQFDSGNAMVKRSVFSKIGLFDEQFNGMRMGDAEFGIRAYINGFKSISNPLASRVHLKVAIGGLREMGSWDGFRPIKWFAPKPIPSVVYLFKKYFPPHLRKNALLLGIILSNIPYHQKKSSSMLILSVLLSILKSPLLLVQYYRASRIADGLLHNASAQAATLKPLQVNCE